jgi:hypothetical protein
MQKQSSLFKKIESPPIIYQNGWDDPTSTTEGYLACIHKANKIVSLVDFLEKDYELEPTGSNNGWNYRMNCPFHNWGNEKVPSLFIHATENRYYCQACAATGGLAEFIAVKYSRPLIAVAEHIINCVEGKTNLEEVQTKKLLDKKKFQEGLIKISDLYREFVHKYKDCDEAIEYANKCMAGFDNVWESNSKQVEASISDLVIKFGKYFERFKS